MTKSELIIKVANITGNIEHAKIALDLCLNKITESILKGNKVSIRGFGSFVNKQKNAKLGYNPSTGRRFFVKPSVHAHFKAGTLLKNKLQTIK